MRTPLRDFTHYQKQSRNMCFSQSASATTFLVGVASIAAAWWYVTRAKLDPKTEVFYRYAPRVVVHQLDASGGLCGLVPAGYGREAAWNGPLHFALNVGQPLAVVAGAAAAAGHVPAGTIATTLGYISVAIYILFTTPLRGARSARPVAFPTRGGARRATAPSSCFTQLQLLALHCSIRCRSRRRLLRPAPSVDYLAPHVSTGPRGEQLRGAGSAPTGGASVAAAAAYEGATLSGAS